MKEKKGFFKLNNKGFAITSVIYGMMLLFIILMTITIATLGRRKILLDKNRDATKLSLNDVDYVYKYKYQDIYKDTYQMFTAPFSGDYRVELWGSKNDTSNGSYTTGIISLTQDEKLYIFIGNTINTNSIISTDGTNPSSSIIMIAAGGGSDKSSNFILNGKFLNPVIIPNDALVPTYNGNGVMLGNTGTGYAKITYMPTTGLIGYDMTNLVKNGSYENGTSDWNITDTTKVSVTSEQSYVGNYSLKFSFNNATGNVVSSQTLDVQAPVLNHKYYGALMYKKLGTAVPNDGRYEWWSNDADSNNGRMIFGEKKETMANWSKLSAISQITDGTYLNAPWTFRNFVVYDSPQSDTIYTDGLILVDLTLTFGEGREPSKEWCDQNISYFDGTIKIYR